MCSIAGLLYFSGEFLDICLLLNLINISTDIFKMSIFLHFLKWDFETLYGLYKFSKFDFFFILVV